jgi:hypothetical protein
MRKLGNAFIGIGFIGVCMMSGVEPIDNIAFYIHAGILTIFALTIGVGIALSRR